MAEPTGDATDARRYEIRLTGHLERRWATWFDGMSLTHANDGTTVLRGAIADQAALHGVLQRLRDLGLPLVSVTQLDAEQPAVSDPDVPLATDPDHPAQTTEDTMKVTTTGLIRSTGIAAVVAGLMFVAIQPLHPEDVLASVTTDAWATIHYATLVMLTLFVVGVTGIYARQVEKIGWLGLAGYVVLVIGLVLTAIGTGIEALVQPLVASTDPAFVEGMLGMVHGHPTDADLGAIPLLWNASSVGFLGGTLLFGFANFRAGILSRWASATFAVGLFAAAPVAGLLGTPRVGAVPIGIGLAWLGYSLWSENRKSVTERAPDASATPREPVAAA